MIKQQESLFSMAFNKFAKSIDKYLLKDKKLEKLPSCISVNEVMSRAILLSEGAIPTKWKSILCTEVNIDRKKISQQKIYKSYVDYGEVD